MTHESGTGLAWIPQAAATGAYASRRLISATRRGAQWWLDVRTEDPVRQTRLRGLLLILPPMLLGGAWIALLLQSLITAIILLCIGLCAIPTRRGSSLGALAMGMGIGVYLSRGIIEQHGGTLTYTSAGMERGTTVTVWLPEHRAGEGAAACTATH